LRLTKTTRTALVFLALVALMAAVAVAFLLSNPLGIQRHLARWALDRDLVRGATVGPRGIVTYWQGGRRHPQTGQTEQTGETLVLVHGIGVDAGSWVGVVGELGRHRPLLVVDLPGHGDSAPPEGVGPLNLDDTVQGLEAAIESAVPRGERVVLLGNSLGGWVSLVYAERHPERVERMILLGASGIWFDMEVAVVPQNLDDARRLVRALSGPDLPMPPDFVLEDLVEKAAAGPTPILWDSFTEDDLLDGRLEAIETPVDLVWGEHDGLVPPTVGRQMDAELPRSRFHLMPGCGHLPQLSCPRQLGALVGELLDAPPPAGGGV
jgi:pimeloyl-ACP methyl ester carboxylesterase